MSAFTTDRPNSVLSVARQLMTQNCQSSNFTMIDEFKDRRTEAPRDLPYITEEGLVLIDRRESDADGSPFLVTQLDT